MVTDRVPARREEGRRTISVRLTGAAKPTEDRLVSVAFPDGFAFRTPGLDLQVDADDDEVVVTDGFSTVYGGGDTLDAAIEDYLASLFDTFADLESQEAILAPGLQRELAALRRHISRVA